MAWRRLSRIADRILAARGAIVTAAALIVVGALLAAGPIPQPPGYHLFADSRTLFGIFGFWNVVSNAPLVLAGVWGLLAALRSEPGLAAERRCYLAIFAGGVLTGLASAWYHHAPGNATLLFDRMAMAVTFMGFAALIVGARIRPAAGRALLGPLVLVGISSTLCWYRSELSGSGDVRLYLLVQFLPMVLAPLILLLWKSRAGERRYFGVAVAIYALAKVAELLDSQTHQLTHFVSGHTLKHLLAALGLAMLARGVAGVKGRPAPSLGSAPGLRSRPNPRAGRRPCA